MLSPGMIALGDTFSAGLVTRIATPIAAERAARRSADVRSSGRRLFFLTVYTFFFGEISCMQ